MQIDSVLNTQVTSTPIAEQRKVSSELGRDEFLRILITQLKNQDPLTPVEDKDFIAQMAQFSSLEQLQSMNNMYHMAQAFQLIDKDITAYALTENGQMDLIQGLVSCVVIKDRLPWLIVNDKEINITDLLEVKKGQTGGRDTI